MLRMGGESPSPARRAFYQWTRHGLSETMIDAPVFRPVSPLPTLPNTAAQANLLFFVWTGFFEGHGNRFI